MANTTECICPTCDDDDSQRPVCASDDVQDSSQCKMQQQACEGDVNVTVAKQGACGKSVLCLGD